MSVTTRQGLIDYCLRPLGSPMVDINVTEEMIQDRVDEALEYFRLYHYDGIEKVYLKHKITSSYLTITTSNSEDFLINETITGQTSEATATVIVLKDIDCNIINIKDLINKDIVSDLKLKHTPKSDLKYCKILLNPI